MQQLRDKGTIMALVLHDKMHSVNSDGPGSLHISALYSHGISGHFLYQSKGYNLQQVLEPGSLKVYVYCRIR